MKYRDQKKRFSRCFAALALLASLVIFNFASTLTGPAGSTVAAFAGAPFPLQLGEAALTCASGFNGATPQPFVVAILDIRDPDCNAPGFDQHWPAPSYHNEMPNPTNNVADEWTTTNLGEVFGIELDNSTNPNIYVTSTTSYGNFGGTGRVFRLDGTTGAISTFSTLPNSGQGLGNIAFDRDHNQFYVTDFEDGKIYRLSSSGAILDTYDPFTPDDGIAGFAPLGERLWGIGVHGCRVYFGVWSQDAGQSLGANTIWSVAIDTTGNFSGSPTLEVTLTPAPFASRSMPVADIAFSRTGNMLVAERGMFGDTGQAPHQARVLEFVGSHLAWAPSANIFNIGQITGTRNSSGGVDYDCAVDDECNAGGHVMATGDALHCCSPPDNIYGLQILPDTGGGLSNSFLVDLDNETNFQDKTQIGDVDINRNCFQTFTCADAGCTRTLGFWKTHNRFAGNKNQKQPWPIDENTSLCGRSWLDILKTPPRGDAFLILAHQWIAARLNVASGAAAPASVTAALAEAEALLNGCSISASDRAGALELSALLDQYNNGVIGPGHCE